MSVKRSTAAQSAVLPSLTGTKQISQRNLRGVAAPLPSKEKNVTLRLAGVWLELWEMLKGMNPKLSDSELIRQAIAVRAAMEAVDSKGQKPKTFIRFHDESGELVTVDLEEHLGITNK
jgi:hypothetical protein